MDDNEIFNIIDNLSEESLIETVGKLNINQDIEEDIDNEIKERIRRNIHKRIERDSMGDENKESKENLNKCGRVRRKLLNGVIGTIAAMVIFTIVVNASPSIAYALEKVAGIDKLVKLVTKSKPYSLDTGFNQIIEQGKYQEVNISDKDKKAEFTVKTIAGDGLKLWIEYDFKGKELITGEIRITDSNNGSLLPWIIRPNDKNYLEIDRTSGIDEFNIEVDIYKDFKELHEPVDINSEEEHLKLVKELEKYKVTTLTLPIKLDENIFGENSYKEYIVQKKVTSEIGDFTVEKLEISTSKTKVHLNLDNSDYSYIDFENFRMVDSENKIYFDSNDKTIYKISESNRSIVIELDGGPSNLENLKLMCGKINYVKNDDKEIIIDLKKNIVEENVYGVTLNKVDGNIIELNVPDRKIDIDFNEENFKKFPINKVIHDYPNNIYTYEFKKISSDKIIFEVLGFEENTLNGFEIELEN